MKKVVSILLALLFIISAGYGLARPLTEFTDPNKTIEADVGQYFIIALASNMTTGFSWRLTKPLNTNILQSAESKYIPSTTRLAGAGGLENWIFKAVGVGQTTVSFEYVRSWEKDVEPAEQAEFVVIVKEGPKPYK